MHLEKPLFVTQPMLPHLTANVKKKQSTGVVLTIISCLSPGQAWFCYLFKATKKCPVLYIWEVAEPVMNKEYVLKLGRY